MLPGPQPAGAFDVKRNVTVPTKSAAGVYVTEAGVVVCAVELNVPPPEIIDQAPVVALPPTLAPVSVIAEGEDDSQTVIEPPAVAVGAAVTVTVAVTVKLPVIPDGTEYVMTEVSC